MFSDFLIRARALFRRKAVERELNDELRFHFEQQVEKFAQSGIPSQEARRRARLMFGATEEIKKECREARGAWRQPLANYSRTTGREPPVDISGWLPRRLAGLDCDSLACRPQGRSPRWPRPAANSWDH